VVFDDVHDPYWQDEAKRLKADKQRRMQVLMDLEFEGHKVRHKPINGDFGKHKQWSIDCACCGATVTKRAPNHKFCDDCRPSWR